MKTLLVIAGILLIIGVADLPIGYYIFLKIVVIIAAVTVVFTEIKSGISFWVILFGIIAILFNPIFPLYSYDQPVGVLINIICSVVFIVKASAPQKQLKI